ncbi:MAG: UDP-3-O-acyl-N-acetylglucosamine deacetylase [Hydrotalea sp.]|nr:UDP-3-O-acyl-N-acetylglucosamine deacetylase [Hydrotalea sp.]MDI9314483.1 UDP-3-O-acyl-N-acetylglucosamine deacetylase [Hydrotalea sp.]
MNNLNNLAHADATARVAPVNGRAPFAGAVKSAIKILPIVDGMVDALSAQPVGHVALLPSLLAGDMVYSPYQWSLKEKVTLQGVGLHNGKLATMTIEPAPHDHGIKFCRADVAKNDPSKDAIVPALFSNVVSAKFSTRIANHDGVCVNTVEHLMAALFAFGIDNALIKIDNDEVPILDGSAQDYFAPFTKAGLVMQRNGKPYRRTYLQVVKQVEVQEKGMTATLDPAEFLDIDCAINYPAKAIGKDRLKSLVSRDYFFQDIASARTFCMEADVALLKANNLGLGGTYDNVVVAGDDGVLNPGGLRFPDEFVRHKFLDIVGDLALSPHRIIGKYQSAHGGHFLNNQMLRKLFSDKDNYRLVILD